MGPYSEERQYQRAESIARLLESDLTDDARIIWQRHLQNLATTETQYNYRVKEIYSKMKKGPIIEWDE
jgi:hypothetical protein